MSVVGFADHTFGLVLKNKLGRLVNVDGTISIVPIVRGSFDSMAFGAACFNWTLNVSNIPDLMISERKASETVHKGLLLPKLGKHGFLNINNNKDKNKCHMVTTEWKEMLKDGSIDKPRSAGATHNNNL